MPEKVGFVDQAELRERKPLGAERVGVEETLDGLWPVRLGHEGEARVDLWGGHLVAQTGPLLHGGD
jgi:hypothetical protein